jgi:hypothetical protein
MTGFFTQVCCPEEIGSTGTQIAGIQCGVDGAGVPRSGVYAVYCDGYAVFV